MSFIISKAQKELFAAIALILLGVGAESAITNNTETIVIDSDYNVYNAKASEVNVLMQDVLSNPTEKGLEDAQIELSTIYGQWAGRQTTDEQNVAFFEYLNACNDVVISIWKGESKDVQDFKISVMDELYSKFN